MSNKPDIIPAWITEAEKQIREAHKDHSVIGMVFHKRRRYGLTMLQNLATNTQDVPFTQGDTEPVDITQEVIKP